MATMESDVMEAVRRAIEIPDQGEADPIQRARPTVRIGQGAGSEFYHHLLAAKRSVVAMAPYIKPTFARKLVELAERGVSVTLVTSEDAAERREVAATLVEQTRHTHGRRRVWRGLGLAVSTTLLLASAVVWPLLQTRGAGRYALYAASVGLIGYLGFRLVRVYSYAYRFRLALMRIIASPYWKGPAGEGSPLMIHAKIYIVDDVPYFASFNLTPEGCFDNFESCVRFEDPEILRYARRVVEALARDQSLRTIDAATLGRALYPEPRA